jgi:hypothetical protein
LKTNTALLKINDYFISFLSSAGYFSTDFDDISRLPVANPAVPDNNPATLLIFPKQSKLQLASAPSTTLNPNKKGKLFYKRKAHLPI